MTHPMTKKAAAPTTVSPVKGARIRQTKPSKYMIPLIYFPKNDVLYKFLP